MGWLDEKEVVATDWLVPASDTTTSPSVISSSPIIVTSPIRLPVPSCATARAALNTMAIKRMSATGPERLAPLDVGSPPVKVEGLVAALGAPGLVQTDHRTAVGAAEALPREGGTAGLAFAVVR